MEEVQDCLKILVAGETTSGAVNPSIHLGVTASSVLHMHFYILMKYYLLIFMVTYINTDFS